MSVPLGNKQCGHMEKNLNVQIMKGANVVENIRYNYIVLKIPTSKEEVLLLKEQRPQISPTSFKQE